MRAIALMVTFILAAPLTPRAVAQEAGLKLNLVIVEGDGAINNIRQRTAREPIVQVEDQNHKPIAGAVVVFTLPENGAGGTFAGGAHSLTVMSDSQGRAVARGFRANKNEGQYQMHVNASFAGLTAAVTISMTNALVAGAAGAAAGGISAKLLAVIIIAGAAVAGGAAYAATRSGGGGSTAASSPVSITPGTGTVGPPR
jgi:hypothetical protein